MARKHKTGIGWLDRAIARERRDKRKHERFMTNMRKMVGDKPKKETGNG